MKVERSTKHTQCMAQIAARVNARVDELVASGLNLNAASKQANDEIVKPELARRAQIRRERSK